MTFRALGRSSGALVLIVLFLFEVSCKDNGDTGSDCSMVWSENAASPVIEFGDAIPAMYWNDPSVLKEGKSYRMWLSGGNPTNPNQIFVDVYEATSSDGASWSIDPTPRLSPSSTLSDWDGLRIETPSVVQVDGVYHLFYSGCDANCGEDGVYSIGHATSPDGTTWTKDPANPVIEAQNTSPEKWGYYGAGEPGILYNPLERLFYLYYVSQKQDDIDPSIVHLGILLATSSDGSSFTHYTDGSGARAVILTRDIPGAISGSWFGYSNPNAIITSSGEFQLYYGFIVGPGGPTTTQTVAIGYATSQNGINFTEADQEIFAFREGDWKNQNVRAPMVVEENDQSFKMWFAGDREDPFNSGIGFATFDCE